jgi:hypothetical protein
MNKEMELYTDYLLSSFGPVTATGLSGLLDGKLSHDAITRMLSSHANDSKALWHEVKSLVRAHESPDACLIFDDTIISKPYTDENELVCWHWDHSKNRNEKGINVLTAFYHTHPATQADPLRVPVQFELVRKNIRFTDPVTGKEKRKSEVTKNDMLRAMVRRAVEQQNLLFRYVLADSWFSSSDNMLFIHKLGKHFIMDLKSNRSCMFSTQDRNKGRWTSLDALPLEPGVPVKVWIKDLEIEVSICKLVFTNKDGSTGETYLASNDVALCGEQFKTLYKRRWSVEEYHKSLKQNASVSKSPTRTPATQRTHLFASLLAYVKLERMKFIHKLNHFALRGKIYMAALKLSWQQLESMKIAPA